MEYGGRKKCDLVQSARSTTPDLSFLTPSIGWKSFPSKSILRSFFYGMIQEFISFDDLNNNSSESCVSGDEFVPVCGNSNACKEEKRACPEC